MYYRILFVILIAFIVGCNPHPNISTLHVENDSLRNVITILEANLDSIQFHDSAMINIANEYEIMLEKNGINVSYTIEKDSVVILEIIEDEFEEESD